MQCRERPISDYVLKKNKLLLTVMEMIIDENMVYLNYKKIIKKNILRPQCNTTKAKPHNSNRETKEEQNNYQMWIEKI